MTTWTALGRAIRIQLQRFNRLPSFCLLLCLLAAIAPAPPAHAAPFIYDAMVTGRTGVDADGDGYFETFDFNIRIDANAGEPVTVQVAAVIWCLTTDEAFLVAPWTITANQPDPVSVPFSELDFFRPQRSMLYFRVELWSSDFSAMHHAVEGLTGEPIPAAASGCSSAHVYSARIADFTGHDANADGCYETFGFNIAIDADAAPGCALEVVARITCTATGTAWQTARWTITGDQLDEQYVSFTHADFALTTCTDLTFAVAICNPALSIKYHEAPVSGLVKAQPRDCPVVIQQAVIENLRYTADADGDTYLDKYDFDIGIDADAPGCSRQVVARIRCNQTAGEWTTTPWTVSGTGASDRTIFSLNYGEFPVAGPTELSFTIQLWDAGQTIALTPATPVSGGPIRAAQPSYSTQLTIYGTLLYRHRDGSLRPMRRARLDILSPKFPQWPGKAVMANDLGEYSSSINTNNQPCSIFIRVKSLAGEPAIVSVQAPLTGSPYYVDSQTRLNYIGSRLRIDLIVGNSGANAGAFHICDSVVEGYNQAQTHLNLFAPQATVYWPASSSCFDGAAIHLQEFDRWDRDIILHEYGHFLAAKGGFDRSPGGDHAWNADLRTFGQPRSDTEAARLAFSEAWASFFSVASQYTQTGDPCLDDSEDVCYSYNLETDTAKHHTPGQFHESMVACAWWDIFDDHDDGADDCDTLQMPLGNIWTVLSIDKPDTASSFWDAWTARFNCKIESYRIFKDHRITSLPPGCTVRLTANIPAAGFTLSEPNSRPIHGSTPAVFHDLPPGTYTATWAAANGVQPPPAAQQTVASGGSATFAGSYAGVDTASPSPNAICAEAIGIDRIAVTSQEASDATPPVCYRILAECYDGQSWHAASLLDYSTQRPAPWMHTGLAENALYRYEQYLRDSNVPPNHSEVSQWALAATTLDAPQDSELQITGVTATGLTISVAPPPTPSGPGETAAFFDILAGEGAGTGAVDRGWTNCFSIEYQNLLPDTEYGWKVRYRGYSGHVTADNPTEIKTRTAAHAPGQPQALLATANQISFTLNTASNPATVQYAIKCIATNPVDPACDQQWIGQCGRPAASPIWLNAQQWDNPSAAGLVPLTSYTFAVVARNSASQPTAFGPSITIRTSVAGDVNGDCKVNIIDMICIRNLLNTDPCSNPQSAAADLNGDGRINILDLLVCRGMINVACPR